MFFIYSLKFSYLFVYKTDCSSLFKLSDDSDEEQDTDNMHFISSLKGMFTKREELDEIDQYLIKKKEEHTLKKKIKEGKKCF